MSDQLRLAIGFVGFLAGAISGGGAVVPDQALSPFKLSHHDAGIRRALPAIEESCDDQVAWTLYADLDPSVTLEIAKNTQRERRRHRRK